MRKQYALESWLREGLYLGHSSIHGQGVITSVPITEGTVAIRWGGIVFTVSELAEGKARQHTHVGIDDDLYLANPIDKPPTDDDFMNHSCDGNLWMADDVTLVARRDIAPGEEVTADYALWHNTSNYKMKNLCNCGVGVCRHTITGLDWQLLDVQRQYAGHFSPFINKLIDKQIKSKT